MMTTSGRIDLNADHIALSKSNTTGLGAVADADDLLLLPGSQVLTAPGREQLGPLFLS